MYTDKSGNIVETQIINDCTLYILNCSGIYRAGNTPKSTISLQPTVIYKKDIDDEIMVPIAAIENTYLNSIYPTILQIKQRIKKLSLSISGDKDKEGIPVMVPLSIFKSAMKIYDITLSELFQIIKDFDKSGENKDGAVIYNLTCREPCKNEEELETQLKTEIRRRKSFSALNTFLEK
jgi:hypothetical protein